jgi:putative ABC transport system permease protein
MSLFREGVAQGFRFVRRDASVAIPAAGILALGLGANIGIFAVAHAVLLRPLPVADQQSLVIMWERSEQRGVSVWEVSYRDFRDWESQNASFVQLAATGAINWSGRLMLKEGPIVVPFAAVSGGFFDVLGTRSALGRALTRADDTRSSPPVAVLSASTWRNHFRSDLGVIGGTAMIDDGAGMSAVTIVGVMPPEFDYPGGAALWIPIAPTLNRLSVAEGYDMLEERGLGILYVLGRLKAGVGLSQARADMDTLVNRLTGTGKPGTGRAIVVTPLVDHVFGRTRPALLLLMGAAGIVLLLTCANVIGLLLAHLSAHRRDLAIRIALGADRSHLIRQAFAEGAALVVAGLAAAAMLAFWSVPFLTALAPEGVPRLSEVTFRTPVLIGFAAVASALTALLCGLLPLLILLRRTRPTLLRPVEPPSRTSTLPVRNGLLVVQTALAVVLLVAATLAVRSFHAIQRVHLGFDPAGLVTFDVLPPTGKYGKHETNNRFYREAIERVRRLPGVSAVAGVYLRPFEFGAIGSSAAVVLDGQSPRDREAWRRNPSLNAEAITPDYFQVMRIPVLQGRAFSEHDTENSPPVVIVSLSAARRLWPGQHPIGKRLFASYDRPKGNWQTVVGLVGDVRYRGLTESTFELYKPYLQSEDTVKHIIVRTAENPSTFVARLRSEIRSVDPDSIVDAIRPMEAVVARQLAPWRFVAVLFSMLAALALMVAVVGLYAVVAHHVTDRNREIGIRIALGARREQIIRYFAMGIARVITTALLAGLLIAAVAARSVNALLFGVAPDDAATYAIVCLLMLVAVSVGAYGPIRRATTVDPIVALRQE